MSTPTDMQIHALKLEIDHLRARLSISEDDEDGEEFGSSLMTWTSWTDEHEAKFKRGPLKLGELINMKGDLALQ